MKLPDRRRIKRLVLKAWIKAGRPGHQSITWRRSWAGRKLPRAVIRLERKTRANVVTVLLPMPAKKRTDEG